MARSMLFLIPRWLGALLLIAAFECAAQQGTAPNVKPLDAIPGAVSSGFKALEGLVGSLVNPKASEFRRLVKDSKLEEAASLYEQNAEKFKANSDLQADIQVLLDSLRSERGRPLRKANEKLTAAIVDKVYEGNLKDFLETFDDIRNARKGYLSTWIISEYAANDPLLLDVKSRETQAQSLIRENISNAYRDFPHEKVAFSKMVGESIDERVLFVESLPAIQRRLESLDEHDSKRLLQNTSVGWSNDAAVRAKLTESILLKNKQIGTSPIEALRSLPSLEAYGLSRSDAKGFGSLYVVATKKSTLESNYSFVQNHDGAYSTLAEALPALSGGSTSPTVLVNVQDSSVNRRILNKREVESRFVSGKRQDLNQAYETARINCQRAQSDYNAQRLRNSINPGIGWGAALQGLAEGLSGASANEVCNKVASTPQYVESDVYSNYSYMVSEIEVVKEIKGDVISIDPKKTTVDAHPFSQQQRTTYQVAYGKKPTDRGGGASTITDAELEATSSSEIKLDPLAIATAVDLNVKTTVPRSEMTASLQQPQVQMVGSSSASKRTKPGSEEGVKPTAEAAKVAYAAQLQSLSDPATQDPRMKSVVVVMNPNGMMGSGFYVDEKEVVTNYHVVEGSTTVELRGSDGQLFNARVVRKDIGLDLALLKVDRSGAPVQFADSIVKAGESVEAIGHPKGLFFSISRGVVSAVRQMKGTLAQGGDKALVIQTDTPINHGNSGGPLYARGKVVGINTLKLKSSEGLGFAVHYSEVIKFLSQ